MKQFILLNDQEGYYKILSAETAIDALRQHVEYCNCGIEENKAFQILCDSGKMTVTELITYANHYLLPSYAEIREIYILGELVAKS